MNKKLEILNNIEIASPCPMSWENMNGDERKRFCQSCKLNVYNLSEMESDEAIDLLIESEGRVCLKLFKRKDGTVITKDCPVGLARARRALKRCAAVVAGLVFWLGLAPASWAQGQASEKMYGELTPPPPTAPEVLPGSAELQNQSCSQIPDQSSDPAGFNLIGALPPPSPETKQQLEAIKKEKEALRLKELKKKQERERRMLSLAALVAGMLSLSGILIAVKRKKSSFIFLGGLSVLVFATVGVILGLGIF